ncbi:hypothetical protein F0562_036128 [Nyssa sinensis]|uniref:BZIP domain-containing protein n=1 Tax=Nyssa sinensis TaxID=561372 RepID=A0A5J5ACU7_9ASTE|nr:hypothetical protein F0562_036128 [Nyssa sinensis]
MWSSSAGNNSCSSKAASSSLSKSSTCSSPPPFSPSSPIPTTPAITRKSMEEVWKDITLSSLPHHPTTIIAAAATSANQHAFHGMILQDFLAHPSHKDPATRVDFDHVPSSARGGRATVFGSSVPPSATNLSLNLGSEFHYLQSTDPMRSNPQLQTHATVGTPSFVIPTFSKKRAPENDHDSRDRRHKRMIKNRESAARSRARRQENLFLSLSLSLSLYIYIYITR